MLDGVALVLGQADLGGVFAHEFTCADGKVAFLQFYLDLLAEAALYVAYHALLPPNIILYLSEC